MRLSDPPAASMSRHLVAGCGAHWCPDKTLIPENADKPPRTSSLPTRQNAVREGVARGLMAIDVVWPPLRPSQPPAGDRWNESRQLIPTRETLPAAPLVG